MLKKPRIIYALIFCALLLAEIYIGMFVHDDFIRPYFGDVLVTVLLCCLCRTVIPKGIPALPIFIFIFAVLVEVAQYLNIVKLMGWENNAFLSTIVGTTFSWLDILCYSVGCLLFWLAESAIVSVIKCCHTNS